MLVDVDRERMASATLQKELEALRADLAGASVQHRREITALHQALADSRQQNGKLEGVLQTVTESFDREKREVTALQDQLKQSNAKAALVLSQYNTLRRTQEKRRRRQSRLEMSGGLGRRLKRT